MSNGVETPVKVNYNIGVGVLGGYEWAISKKESIALEMGLCYGFPRGIEIPVFNLSFKEYHLYIPLSISFTKVHKASFYFAASSIFGYEFDAPFISRYKQSGDYVGLNAEFKGDKNVRELLPNLTSPTGSILVGIRLNFPKGIYFKFLTRLNMDLSRLNPIEREEGTGGLDEQFVTVVRVLSTNLMEFNLGLNIMELYYPKDRLQPKDQEL